MNLEQIIAQLGELRGEEFKFAFQFASAKEQTLLLNSNLSANDIYSLLLGLKGSCSTEALNESSLEDLLNFIKEHQLSSSQISKAVKLVTESDVTLDQLLSELNKQ